MKFLFIILLLVFSLGVVSAYNQNGFLEKVSKNINSNQDYLNFIDSSGYKLVELIVGNDSYYFQYDNSVSLVDEGNPDFIVVFSDVEFENFMDAYNFGNVGILKKMIFEKIPFRVKFNVFFQCLKTSWCRTEIF